MFKRPFTGFASLRLLASLHLASSDTSEASSCAAIEPHRDSVVLLHGLGRTAISMKRLEWALRKHGYRVINLSYPSCRLSVESAASWLDQTRRNHTFDPASRVHFVAHSLGGIVVRHYLAHESLSNLGRVVMLGTPNQGSEVADRLKGNLLYRLFTGSAGQQLGTEPSSAPNQLGPAQFEVGVIAGDRSLNPWLSASIPNPNDGKVSVQSTRLVGMTDFLVVHYTHTWIMWRKSVVDEVIQFLQTGHFDDDPSPN